MKTIEINLYSFDELSEQAQQRALADYTSDMEYFWTDEWFETIKKGLEFFGWRLKDWSIALGPYPDRGEFTSIENENNPLSSWEDNPIEELSGVRLWKYLMNNYSEYYCKYQKKMRNTFDWNCPFTGYCGDETFLDPVRRFLKNPSNATTFRDLMEDCVQNAINGLHQDCEYQESVEAFKDTCDANDYYFTEDGELS